MANKLSFFQAISTISLILTFVISANAEVTFEMIKDNKKKLELLIKQHPKVRSTDYLILENLMNENERTDVDNKYFKYSYDKCADPEVPYGANKNLKETTIVVFNRSEACGAKSKYEEILLITEAGKRASEHINQQRLSARDNEKYDRLIKINGADGNISAELKLSEDEKSFGKPFLKWVIDVVCKDNYSYEMIFSTRDEQDTLRRLTNKDYEIPEEIKRLVSSFRCVK